MTRLLRADWFILLVTVGGAASLHWGVGWFATPLAGVGAGVWSSRWHWPIGALGVGLAWAGAVVYTAGAAPGAFRVLLDTLGALAGTIPGDAFVALPVVLGSLLGGLGGAVGRCLRLLATGE